MPKYTPFLISNFMIGKLLNREPWLLPGDAFVELDNCHLKRGVLEKRLGYTSVGQLVHTATNTDVDTLQTQPVMGIANHISGTTETPLAFTTDRMNIYSGGAFVDATRYKIRFDAGGNAPTAGDVIEGATSGHYGTLNEVQLDNGTWAGANAIGTLVFENASYSGVFQNNENLQTVQVAFTSGGTYQVLVGDTIAGAISGNTAVVRKIDLSSGTWAGGDAAGTFHLTAQSGALQAENLNVGVNLNVATIGGDATTTTIAVANGTASDDTFTGDYYDFFQVVNWRDVTNGVDYAYITNDQDAIQRYNGTNLTQLTIDLDVEGGPDNDVSRARLIFIYKERIIIFNTTEKGVVYPLRGRWCNVKNATTWSSADFTDAPASGEQIVAGGILGDDLFIWTESSVWRFVWTGDATNPFIWEKVTTANYGSGARMGLVGVRNFQYVMGGSRIYLNDGRIVQPADFKLPDYMLEWVQQSIQYGQGADVEEERQVWLTFADASAGSTTNEDASTSQYPNRVLGLNYEENNHFTYTLPIHTIGFSRVESDLTWNDVNDAWEDILYSWDAGNIQAGFPITLFGSRDGFVYQANITDADNGSSIEFTAKTGQLNPYNEAGIEAILHKIDFLCDADDSTFSVNHYINQQSSSTQTFTVTNSANYNSGDKSWQTVYVNTTALFHQLEITHDESGNRPKIHAICLWFAPGGLRNG